MSKVIMYHYIRNFNEDLPFFNFLHQQDFKKQTDIFVKKNILVKLDEKFNEIFLKKKILLSFDDGLKEHLKIAKYLKSKNIMGIFFIPTYQLEKLDFLPIHKIHLIFGKLNSDELIVLFKKFKFHFEFNDKVFAIFNKQKHFLDKKSNLTENDKKIFLKTILNNYDQKNPSLVKKIFNHCFSISKQRSLFKKFYLNKKDLIEIDKIGMKIGSHGHQHKVLSKLSYKNQSYDISKSINLLSKIIGQKINHFCFPYGGYEVFNKDTLKILKKKKYSILSM